MRRRRTTGRTAKAKPTIKAKRGTSSKAGRNQRLSALTKDTVIARLSRERDEALEQLSAASDVLNIISTSPDDLGPIFHAILENATRICEAKFGVLLMYNGVSTTLPMGARRILQIRPPQQRATSLHRLLRKSIGKN